VIGGFLKKARDKKEILRVGDRMRVEEATASRHARGIATAAVLR
jgi:hypothetical protein